MIYLVPPTAAPTFFPSAAPTLAPTDSPTSSPTPASSAGATLPFDPFGSRQGSGSDNDDASDGGVLFGLGLTTLIAIGAGIALCLVRFLFFLFI